MVSVFKAQNSVIYLMAALIINLLNVQEEVALIILHYVKTLLMTIVQETINNFVLMVVVLMISHNVL